MKLGDAREKIGSKCCFLPCFSTKAPKFFRWSGGRDEPARGDEL